MRSSNYDSSPVPAHNNHEHSSMGSLADELAIAMHQNEDDDTTSELSSSFASTPTKETPYTDHLRARARDSGICVTSSPLNSISANVTPVRKPSRFSKYRLTSQSYDGSDYGPMSDDESDDFLHALDLQITAVDRLSRQALLDFADPRANPVPRVVRQLTELAGQSDVEAEAMRLSSACEAVAATVAGQARALQQLVHAIPAQLHDAAAADELLQLVAGTADAIPRVPAPPLAALRDLSRAAQDVKVSLGGVADAVQMTRETAETAARRLEGARLLVARIRNEAAILEEGLEAIGAAGWQRRIASRESARVCQDVIRGFEETCGEYRATLVARVAARA